MEAVRGVVLLIAVAVAAYYGSREFKRERRQFRTIRLRQGHEVCLVTGRSRQCFGVDGQGRLGWYFPGAPCPGGLFSFQELVELVRNSQEGKEELK